MSNSSPTIFIVEDETLIAMEIRDRLTRLGYTVLGIAARGEEALEQMTTCPPDVALMDVRLAGTMNGIETAARLRETTDIAVIFLTAYSDAQLIKQAGETEPYGYLVKPFEERELHATIQMALYRRRMERALRQAIEDLLSLQAERAALAIDNARLYEEARSQLESWRALADNAPDIISRFDRELRHLYVNPAVESATGLPASAMIGKSNREFGMPEPLVDAWELALRQVFRYGQERRLEFSLPTPSGERHYQARVAPEHGPDGAVQTVLMIARDVTDQKQADQQRDDLYRELLERDRRLHDLVSRVLLERDSGLPHQAIEAKMVSTTPRERAILRLMAVGKTNQQIGLELGLSAGTVKNHVARVIEKLAVPDRTAAAVRAVQLGLIRLD